MLAGQPAFPGDNLLELHDRICAGAYVPLGRLRPDLPPRMLEAVERCLRVDRAERPAHCDELLALWCGYYRSAPGEDPLCAKPRSESQEAPTWVIPTPDPPRPQPSRWLVVAALAVVLLVVSVACAIWAQSG
jgi:hypothetical protein